MHRPDYSTSPEYYHYYFDLSEGKTNLIEALKLNCEELVAFFCSVPEEKIDFRYAEAKWSVKEILLHIIETERVFSYRALSFSRKSNAELHSFDENEYIQHANANERSFQSLVSEFISLRTANLLMFSGFTSEMLDFQGKANGISTNARGIAWFLIGHGLHHAKVVKERYL